DQTPAMLLLGLSVGAIGDDDLPASVPHGCCGAVWLECFSAEKMPAPAKLVVIRKTPRQERLALAFGHLGPVGFVSESKASELHSGTFSRWISPINSRSRGLAFDSAARVFLTQFGRRLSRKPLATQH